ncbi:hypothetical protein B0H67DRAFT_641432 [Lasiosphaeris hirsuta]|uniref:Uncharacterized protein n=1 Tax=Lasiosphaeris hirsuta TaxID=260670 RepID=A0AA40E760_9PEZI|nr:hypothetical protein B0H67DRAFT_641432 [Lasiosphaeris hirsuta]
MLLSYSVLALSWIAGVSRAQLETPKTYSPLAPIFVSSAARNGIIEGVNDEAWNTAFLSVNVTGSATIDGLNTSQPYPGSASDQWKYTIKVRDNVPFSSGGQYMAGTSIQLEAPKDLLTDVGNGSVVLQDRSWHICQLVFAGPALKSGKALPGPGCTGFLDTTCIADLTSHLVTGFGNRNRTGPDNLCPLPRPGTLPQSCNATFGTRVVGLLGGLETDNRHAPENGTFSFMRFGIDNDKHQPGNNTAFDEASSQVFVVGHIWGYESAFVGEAESTVSAALTCLRAGSDPKEEPTQGDDPSTQTPENPVTAGQNPDGPKSSASMSLQLGSLLLMLSSVTFATGMAL